MKKLFITASAALLFTTILTGCKKDDSQTFHVSFYTPTSSQVLRLYVDGTDYGPLPYLTQTPSCPDAQPTDAKALVKDLVFGTYQLECRNPQGTVVTISTVRLYRGGSSISGNLGSTRVENNDACVAVGLGDY